MKIINKITKDNWQEFKVSIVIESVLDNNINGLTIMKKNKLIDKLFGLKRIKLINNGTNRYNIYIYMYDDNDNSFNIKIDDLETSKYLIPFISFYSTGDLEFLNVQYLPNLNIEHVFKHIKKSLEDISELDDFIKYVILLFKQTIKDEKYIIKKKNITTIDKLNTTVDNFKIKIEYDIKNNFLPKSLVEYLDIYGSNSLFQ